jgi:hypothetical protein
MTRLDADPHTNSSAIKCKFTVVILILVESPTHLQQLGETRLPKKVELLGADNQFKGTINYSI